MHKSAREREGGYSARRRCRPAPPVPDPVASPRRDNDPRVLHTLQPPLLGPPQRTSARRLWRSSAHRSDREGVEPLRERTRKLPRWLDAKSRKVWALCRLAARHPGDKRPLALPLLARPASRGSNMEVDDAANDALHHCRRSSSDRSVKRRPRLPFAGQAGPENRGAALASSGGTGHRCHEDRRRS